MRVEVTPPQPSARMHTTVGGAGHDHFDWIRGIFRQAVPPGSGQAGRGRPRTVAPYRNSNTGGIRERPIVDEIDTGPASSPSAGPSPASDGVLTEPDQT